MNSQSQYLEWMAFRMKLQAILTVSKQFLQMQKEFQSCPTPQGFSRHLRVTVEFHQAMVPEKPGWQGLGIAFALYRSGLVVISYLNLFWKRWLKAESYRTD
jgi:hypothetical protein